MSVDLNHTIVMAHDNRASAEFLAHILGLRAGDAWGPFVPLELGNGVTLDYMATDRDIPSQHYAFLVSEEEFDGIFARVEAGGVTYYSEPGMRRAHEINRNDGGRGFYFRDPGGHSMEVITRPYGSGGS